MSFCLSLPSPSLTPRPRPPDKVWTWALPTWVSTAQLSAQQIDRWHQGPQTVGWIRWGQLSPKACAEAPFSTYGWAGRAHAPALVRQQQLRLPQVVLGDPQCENDLSSGSNGGCDGKANPSTLELMTGVGEEESIRQQMPSIEHVLYAWLVVVSVLLCGARTDRESKYQEVAVWALPTRGSFAPAWHR